MNLKYSILSTLIYHDIFDYPLTIEEINLYLTKKTNSLVSVKKALKNLVKLKKIGELKNYYFISKKRNLVQLRLTKAKYSQEKLKKAHIYSKILKLNPFVLMVGISGALSMENSNKVDDIDFVIITKAKLLWTTRLLTNAFLFPVKRQPGTNTKNNSACLNLFIDESDLKIKDENIYQAHEICQLKPLWQRNNVYNRFIGANKWVYEYLPNWKPQSISIGPQSSNNRRGPHAIALSNRRGAVSQQSTINNIKSRGVLDSSLTRPERSRRVTYHFSLVEIFLKKFQLFYMKGKISTERIGENQLFFHPKNTQSWVLEEYHKRMLKIRTF